MPRSSDCGTLPARSNGKHPGGRPTKRTPATVAKIAEVIADGLPDEYACALVGIHRDTLHQWRNDPEFREFSDAIKKAEAFRMQKRIAQIEAGNDQGCGIRWVLERRWPRDFCRPEIQFNQQFNVQVNAADHSVQMIPQTELLEMTELTREIEAEVMG